MEYLYTLSGSNDAYLVLDRADNDGHYEPGNLRFVTPSQSLLNRQRKGIVNPLGTLVETQCVSVECDEDGKAVVM